MELGVECQQVVCLLHLNELFLRHRQVKWKCSMFRYTDFFSWQKYIF